MPFAVADVGRGSGLKLALIASSYAPSSLVSTGPVGRARADARLANARTFVVRWPFGAAITLAIIDWRSICIKSRVNSPDVRDRKERKMMHLGWV